MPEEDMPHLPDGTPVDIHVEPIRGTFSYEHWTSIGIAHGYQLLANWAFTLHLLYSTVPM